MRKTMVIGISLLFFIGIASQASARKLHCWDLNENYDCDIETEDMNNDGKCNSRDCETEEQCYAVPQTGQTTSYEIGDDGDLERGIVWPDPRFSDNGDGTVTDNLTGLIWLKNAFCIGAWNWATALTECNNLKSGECGLTDGSIEGDWRLPNVKELQSLIDYGSHLPALPSGHPFTGIVPGADYWSSTTDDIEYYQDAWGVNMGYGDVNDWNKTYPGLYVWPVRGGN